MSDLISRQDVNQLIDEVLENNNLQASPTVWHCLHRLKELPSTEVMNYKFLWCKLYNYINDWAFGVAPDETTPNNEKQDRITIYNTLQEVLNIMLDIAKREEITDAN